MPIVSRFPISRLSRFARGAVLAALAIAALMSSAAPLAAQGSTTGAIRGRVTDESGQPLTGATVTATNAETGLSRTAQVGEDGIYTILLLPPGTYRVTARRIGQQQSEVGDIRVVVGTTTPVNFSLRAAAVTLTGVQVTAAPGTADVTDAGVRTTVTREEITSLPTLGRDFTDFINLSGLVSPNPEETTGGQFSIGGQRPSQTNLQIDGVDANNSFFGENRGSSRIPFAFSLESIREFQVITNGFDVEYGNYSGGIVNIVTRGGTNDFRGTLFANYRGDQLTAENFDRTPINNFEAQQFAGSIEGPIIEDQLFYLFSVDGQRRREPFRSASPALFRERGQEDRAEGMEEFLDLLENQYGIPNPAAGYGEWEVTQDVLTFFARLDWNLNEQHRVSLRNNYSTYKNQNEAGSFAFEPGLSASETIRDRANSAVGELTSTLGAAFNVLRVQYATEERPRIPNSRVPEIQVRITPQQTIRYGGSGLVFDNSLDESKLQIVDNLTLVRGAHTIKLGTNNTFSWFNNRFWNGGNGSFVFNNLADFEAGRPTSYVRNIRADSTAPVAKFGSQEWSFYAQDDWQIRPRLLGSFGLRYDITRYSDRPGRVIDVERAFGFETGIAPIDDNNISPRAALTWDVRGDASQIVRVGAGLFYGRVPYVMGSNVALTEQALLRLECRGSFAEGAPDAPPVPDFANWDPNGSDNPFTCLGGTSAIQGVPEFSFWHDGFEIPETIKANIGYERALPNFFRGKVDLIVSESRKLYTVRNLNLREPQFVLDSEGGRRVFVPEGVFNPSSAAGPERLRNTDFSNLFVNHNDGVSRSVAASFELSRPLGDEASIRGSYTWMWAYDNSSFSCCTSFAGFTDQTVGALGPNEIGSIGDENGSWGASEFVRNHTFVFSGYKNDLPWGLRLSAIWRIQSGKPWGPEQSGDLNGDGRAFNDRPYIYRPSELPVFVPASETNPAVRDSIVGANRALYAQHLREFECVGEHQGRIIPRNTCRQPWFNSLDLSLRKTFPTRNGQSAELQVDLFNVLNGINRSWGRNMDIRAANRNLLSPQGYDPETQQILYTVPDEFGQRSIVGTNLIQQFSAQIGIRYSF